MNMLTSRTLAIASGLLIGIGAARAAWTAGDAPNPDLPGRRVDIHADGELVARLIHGDGQIKPYLHVFGQSGDCLTEWSAEQKYPHHRGIFIGWNKIASELGVVDLWHLNRGGSMRVVRFEAIEGGPDAARLVAVVAWRGVAKEGGDDLLLTETRTMVVSRPGPGSTQVDARFVLKAERDLTLGGDLQHAGVHFRAAKELVERAKETSYQWEPDLPGPGGKVVSPDLKWCRFLFPVGNRWYTCTQLNAPTNPVQELSWRDYGRFGFFFARDMKAGEELALDYRFVTAPAEPPATPGKPSPEQTAADRAAAAALYDAYVQSRR